MLNRKSWHGFSLCLNYLTIHIAVTADIVKTYLTKKKYLDLMLFIAENSKKTIP